MKFSQLTILLFRTVPALVPAYFFISFNSAAASPFEPYETNESTALHPKLFFQANKVEELRRKAQSTHSEIWQPIIDYVTWRFGDSAPPAGAPDEGQSAYRNYANRLLPFAFCAAMTGLDSLKNFAKSYLLRLASWQQWGNNGYRDLALAHMLLANSLAYDWLYNELNESERQLVRSSLTARAEQMYEASAGARQKDWGNWWRKSYVQNHHWINNSALGLAGLTLLGEDSRAQKWIDQAVDQMKRVQFLLDGVGDGSWHEGMHYQSYGLTLSLPFLRCLKDIQQIDLLPATYLQNYVDWRIYNDLPGSTSPLFSHGDYERDWGNAYPPQNILRFIAAEFKDGSAEWMTQQIIAKDGRYANQWRAPWYVFEFLYYDPQIAAMPPNDKKLEREFPDFSGIIWRTGWHEEAMVFGLKCGGYAGRFAIQSFISGTWPWQQPYSESGGQLNIGHDHDDTNTFYLFNRGNWLAGESESNGGYATSLHNSILIDGQGQYRPGSNWKEPAAFVESAGMLQKHFTSVNFNFVATDATARYKNTAGITGVNREVLFVKPGYFLIFDRLTAETNHQYTWITHFEKNVSVEDNWIRGGGENGQALAVGVLRPRDFSITTGDDGKPFVRISSAQPIRNESFVTFLQPLGENNWLSRPAISLMAETENARLFKVINNLGPSFVDEVIMEKRNAGIKPVAHYQTDTHLAIVRRDGSGNLSKLLFYNGSYLKDDSRQLELIASERNSVFIDVDYAQKTVYIHGAGNGQIRIYGADLNAVYANDSPIPFRKAGPFLIINADKVAPAVPTGVQIEVQ